MKKQLITFAVIISLCASLAFVEHSVQAVTLEQQNAAYNKLAVTNKAISVDVVDKESLAVLRSFTLQPNRVIEVKKDIPELAGKQIIIKKKRQPTDTIFVTYEKNTPIQIKQYRCLLHDASISTASRKHGIKN